jgi:hypothetical protein
MYKDKNNDGWTLTGYNCGSIGSPIWLLLHKTKRFHYFFRHDLFRFLLAFTAARFRTAFFFPFFFGKVRVTAIVRTQQFSKRQISKFSSACSGQQLFVLGV